ncbi:hypothetical protein [Metamycoplasma hyosynoviae]|uniref:Uncharacterized protein n=1 Tax=Metamycoplasma hyosynoviae TaxID=29559 RepID=A0A9Q9F366_9BACT|nr:hypothetical protein [Metamycoplasma hyosynoviae]MDC8919691.1 hypothetical protein [Metamycoplasma hyosynoviae]MDC8962286.1 hypothetical protein [Metamycoplasma hyosynoviae]MDD7847510.1 hypothetical protein [Metamycoplasma hyosynoviae]MDD7912403.1 hypothetical protein [Metamycoplasma hyosynoviae]UTO25750.1 hypothetical protein NMG93_02645 [Metamycoplasma hyosynoviae]
MEEWKKLNLSIEEFKRNYWYSNVIEIPQFIKNIGPTITEEVLFNKLMLNVLETCDLFIDQKMSQILALDISLEQIKQLLGNRKVNNFISSVYTEIKYRLATEKFPEFSQKDKLITSAFSLASAGREFTNFQSLLSPESIAYLTNPSWNDLQFNKEDYLQIISVLEELNLALGKLKKVDTKIENLLKDNSELDANLKSLFSQFKTEQIAINETKQDKESFDKFKVEQIAINDQKEDKLNPVWKKFFNENLSKEGVLGPKIGEDSLTMVFDHNQSNTETTAIYVESEYSKTNIIPGRISLENIHEGNGLHLSDESLKFEDFNDENNKKTAVLNLNNLTSILEATKKTPTIETKLSSLENELNVIKTKINSTQLQKRTFLQHCLESLGLLGLDIEFQKVDDFDEETIERIKNDFDQDNTGLVIYVSDEEINQNSTNYEKLEMIVFYFLEDTGLVSLGYYRYIKTANLGGFIIEKYNNYKIVKKNNHSEIIGYNALDSKDKDLSLNEAKLIKLNKFLSKKVNDEGELI